MSQQLPEGLQTHIGHAKEVEFQHANDRVVHVLPLGEVVAQPVTPVLPTADESRPTQDKRPLASCLLGSTAKNCNKIIKNRSGKQKSHKIRLSFPAQLYLGRCYP